MGCLHSKKETSDLHPNVFRVVNVDENGVYLCSGQLEITENDLILYREGRDSTVWPLHSLRRYGFEEGMFSFESGRRCETGEGIYAFKCRRASVLFQTLQQQILLKNVINVHPVSRLTPSPQGRQTLQASVVHRSSIDNGQPNSTRPMTNNNLTNIITESGVLRSSTQSPRSPSSGDILEVMPLYPRPQNTSNQVTNVYQFRDFKREHNNNQTETTVDNRHVYSNDLSRDLAILRNALRQETALNTMRDIEDETRFLETRYINESVINTANTNPLNTSNDAQLNQEQQPMENARLYMNIVPNGSNVAEVIKSDTVPTTPLTPKQLEYCNITVGNKPELNTYANLSLGELGDSVKNMKHVLSFSIFEQGYKFSESEPLTSMSPIEEIEVNYAVLDIDTNKETLKNTKNSAAENKVSGSKNESAVSSVKQRGRIVSQCSVEKTAAVNGGTTAQSATQGYTTIDFDKTVALTSVAAGEDITVGLEGPRKTRHNSCNFICTTGSPAINEKHKNS